MILQKNLPPIFPPPNLAGPFLPAPPSPGLAPTPDLAGALYGTYGFFAPTAELVGLLKLETDLVFTAAFCQLVRGPGTGFEGPLEDGRKDLFWRELGLLDWIELALLAIELDLTKEPEFCAKLPLVFSDPGAGLGRLASLLTAIVLLLAVAHLEEALEGGCLGNCRVLLLESHFLAAPSELPLLGWLPGLLLLLLALTSLGGWSDLFLESSL